MQHHNIFYYCNREGGVLIAVNKKFASHRSAITDNNVIEQVFVKISFISFCLIVGAIYNAPPNYDILLLLVCTIHYNIF